MKQTRKLAVSTRPLNSQIYPLKDFNHCGILEKKFFDTSIITPPPFLVLSVLKQHSRSLSVLKRFVSSFLQRKVSVKQKQMLFDPISCSNVRR